MSLVAWYPLNGNTNDYSGNGYNGYLTGTTLPTETLEGKIGKSYIFTNTNNGVNIPNKNFNDLYDFTITAWINPAGSHRNYDGAIISSGDWNGTHWSFGIRQGNNGFSCRNPYITVANAPYDFSLNTWHFVVYRRKGSTLSLFANNTLVYEGANINNNPLSSNYSNTMIARETYADGYFAFNGKINDVRIYDHALSEKEIKEIAKAKILHYTFDDFQEPTTNLFQTPITFVGNASNIGTSLWNKENNFKIYGTDGASGTAAFIAISAYTSPVDIPNITISLQNPININRWILRLYDSTGTIITTTISGWTYNIYYQAYYKDGMSNTTNLNIILPSSVRKVGFGVFGTGGGVVCSIEKLMIEAKAYTTPFVDGSRSGIVNDQSGFRNNATLTEATTPRWVSDSKIGSGAYKFLPIENDISPTYNYIMSNNNTILILTEFTYSTWIKTTDSNGWLIMGSRVGNNTVMSLAIINGKLNLHKYTYNNNSDKNIANSITSLNDGNWHLATITYNNGLTKTYIDGILESTETHINTSYGQYPFQINYDNGMTGAFTNRNFIGQLDDIRVYATALPDSDILELYQTRASLDNIGNLFIGEIKQSDNLAPNPSFEEDPLGAISTPTGWIRESGDGFNIVTSDSPNTKSLKALHYPKGSYRRIRSNWFKVTPGETIYGQCYAKGETGSSFYFGLYWKTTSTYSYFTSGVGTSWTLKSGSLVVPAGVTEAGIWLFNYGTPTGDLWTDDVYVSRRSNVNLLNEIQEDSLGERVTFTEEGFNKSYNISELGITDGLVAYYPLDKDARDYSGNGNHGTLVGTPTLISGIKSQGYYFAGSGQGISLSYNSLFNIREAITLSIWIKRTTDFNQTQDCFILSRPPSWYFYDAYASGNIQGEIFIDGIRRGARATAVPFDGNWYHVLYTYDSSTKTSSIYKNGSLVSSTTLSGLTNYLIDSSTENFSTIGLQTLGRGLILDEARIYNRALTPEEVSILYETTALTTAAMKITKDTVYLKGEFKEVI